MLLTLIYSVVYTAFTVIFNDYSFATYNNPLTL